MGARLHGLRQSSNDYPVNLLLLEGKELIGHARLSRVLGSRNLFVESVVVQPGLRGKGYGRALMEGVERYARGRGCTRLYLTTHDKQHFYAHIGYVSSRPVQNVGTLASIMPMELLHKFCRTSENEGEGGREIKKRDEAATSPKGPPLPPVFPTSSKSASSLHLPPPPPPPPLVLLSVPKSPPFPALNPSPCHPPPASAPSPSVSSPISSPPPAPPPPPPSSWTPVDQTLEQMPYTDSRGLPIFWMHKDI
ncbi:N-alpha-acetyltransferase 80 isoform X2 [Hoplias malabaricus]